MLQSQLVRTSLKQWELCPILYTQSHLTAAKRILRYLKGTAYLGLSYKKCADGNLIGYSDADWAGDVNDRHFTSGNVFLLAKGGVSWLSKKQATVALD